MCSTIEELFSCDCIHPLLPSQKMPMVILRPNSRPLMRSDPPRPRLVGVVVVDDCLLVARELTFGQQPPADASGHRSIYAVAVPIATRDGSA